MRRNSPVFLMQSSIRTTCNPKTLAKFSTKKMRKNLPRKESHTRKSVHQQNRWFCRNFWKHRRVAPTFCSVSPIFQSWLKALFKVPPATTLQQELSEMEDELPKVLWVLMQNKGIVTKVNRRTPFILTLNLYILSFRDISSNKTAPSCYKVIKNLWFPVDVPRQRSSIAPRFSNSFNRTAKSQIKSAIKVRWVPACRI